MLIGLGRVVCVLCGGGCFDGHRRGVQLHVCYDDGGVHDVSCDGGDDVRDAFYDDGGDAFCGDVHGSSGGVIRLAVITESGIERKLFAGKDIPVFWHDPI